MIIPSFVDIIHYFTIYVEDKGMLKSFNKYDLEIYRKYYWAYELKISLLHEYIDGHVKPKAS